MSPAISTASTFWSRKYARAFSKMSHEPFPRVMWMSESAPNRSRAGPVAPNARCPIPAAARNANAPCPMNARRVCAMPCNTCLLIVASPVCYLMKILKPVTT